MLAVVRCGLTSSPRRLVQPNRDRPAERLASHLWPLPLENVTDGAAPSRPEPAFADLGLGDPSATVLATDNLPNMQVTNNIGSSTRSRSFLERYKSTQQRIKEGILAVVHVRDENMPADFLTKWVAARKLNKSLTYATGGAAKLTAKERKTGN